MTRTSFAILTIVLAIGNAHAQMSSDVADRTAIAHPASGPDGTVGALQAVVRNLATSADDVAAQQEGRSTAAERGASLDHRPVTAGGAAPGTVGAAPGNDLPR